MSKQKYKHIHSSILDDPTPDKEDGVTLNIAACGSSKCSWKGLVRDCESYMDSEGWEYPEYEVHICPECGEDLLDYDYIEENWKAMPTLGISWYIKHLWNTIKNSLKTL